MEGRITQLQIIESLQIRELRLIQVLITVQKMKEQREILPMLLKMPNNNNVKLMFNS